MKRKHWILEFLPPCRCHPKYAASYCFRCITETAKNNPKWSVLYSAYSLKSVLQAAERYRQSDIRDDDTGYQYRVRCVDTNQLIIL